MTQVCVSCGIEKPLVAFEKQKNRPRSRKKCKDCRYKERDLEKERVRHREYSRERRKINPVAVRQNYERSVYGVSKEDIGVKSCMICDSVERLCIDHDHNSGNVRGILCTKCNAGLGQFRDNPHLLTKASEYLKDGPHWQLPWSRYK